MLPSRFRLNDFSKNFQLRPPKNFFQSALRFQIFDRMADIVLGCYTDFNVFFLPPCR
eukprot:UN28195